MTTLIGITMDVEPEGRHRVGPAYAERIAAAGGTPILLPCRPECIPAYLDLCAGFVFTGGDDPAMEPWGGETHPAATPLHPQRQAFEVALLEALEADAGRPVLGVCLGMQLMALVAGGQLDQHLPDRCPTAADHWGRRPHAVRGPLGDGVVHSHHRQAVTDPGRLRVTATAPDGIIEAIDDPARPFYVGVQWHPERTEDETLGAALFSRLVAAATTAPPRSLLGVTT